MSDKDERLHDDWLRERCPNDAGDGHWWGWITAQGARGNAHDKDIFWLHRCEGRLVLGTIDVSTPVHTLVCEEPLHVEPSILCSQCGDHGYLREGRWVKA